MERIKTDNGFIEVQEDGSFLVLLEQGTASLSECRFRSLKEAQAFASSQQAEGYLPGNQPTIPPWSYNYAR